MPRVRTRSDEEILDATERVLLEKGPHAFTLADVARDVGLSPATLLQRFGTKQKLLVAFSKSRAHGARASFTAAAKDEEPALTALKRQLRGLAKSLRERDAMVNSLGLLLEDVRQPELRAPAKAQAEATEAGILALLERAVTEGELKPLAPRELVRLARTVSFVYNGALIQWALRGTGRLEAWVDGAVDGVLAPYQR